MIKLKKLNIKKSKLFSYFFKLSKLPNNNMSDMLYYIIAAVIVVVVLIIAFIIYQKSRAADKINKDPNL